MKFKIIFFVSLLMFSTFMSVSAAPPSPYSSEKLVEVNGDVEGNIDNSYFDSINGRNSGYGIYGNINFIGDSTLNFSRLDQYTLGVGALNAFNGNSITADAGKNITINILNDNSPLDIGYIGIYAYDGGSVDFSENSVSINSTRIGVQATNSTVELGKNSVIDAREYQKGIAVFAYNHGQVVIGDNATLKGTISSSSEATVSANSNSSITVGAGAKIINDGTYTYSAQTFHYHHAVLAQGASQITIGDGSDISTYIGSENGGDVSGQNQGNYAIVAHDQGTKVTIGESSTISTSSDWSFGIFAHTNGAVELKNGSKITVTGSRSAAIHTQGGANIVLGDHITIKTTSTKTAPQPILSGHPNPNGTESHGISISTKSSVVAGNYLSIETHGKRSVGIVMAGGKATIGDHLTIRSLGEGEAAEAAYGISLSWENSSTRTPAEIDIGDFLDVHTKGYRSRGVTSTYYGKIKIGDDATVKTSGNTAYGVSSSSYSNITIGDRSTIVTEGQSSHAAVGSGGNLTIGKEAKIKTFGNSSYAVYSTSESYPTIITIGDGAYIETTGEASGRGIFASTGGKVNLGKNITVKTSGALSHASYSTGNNSQITLGENSSLNTSGEQAHGVYLHNGGIVNLGENTNILTQGADADVFVLNLTANSNTLSFNKLTATSLKSNLITAATGSDVTFSFKDSVLFGDVLATGYKVLSSGNWIPFETGEINLILEGSSTWQGSKAVESHFEAFTDEEINDYKLTYSWTGSANKVNLKLMNTSSWLIGKDSYMNSVDFVGNAASIKFLKNTPASYFSLSVDDINGQGTIEMNVDMTLGSAKGNHLKATDATGAFAIDVKHNDIGGNDTLELIFVTNHGNVSFSLANSDEVQIGSYIYGLENNSESWYLKLARRDITIEDDVRNGILALFEFGKSIDASLSDELLKKKDELWLLSFYKLQKFSHNDLTNDFKQQIVGGIAGMTQDVTENLSVGEFFGLNIGYQNLREGSLGHVSNLTAGVYLIYNKNNFNGSIYARISNYTHDLRLQKSLGGILSETLYTKGFSISAQLSQKLPLTASGLYVEPKLKASYTNVVERVYNVGGTEIKNLAENGLVTWLGARVGSDKETSDNKPYGYYLEAGWIHDTKPSITYVIVEEQSKGSVTLGKNRFEVGVGLILSPLAKSELNVEVKYSKGGGIEEPIKLKLEGSVSF